MRLESRSAADSGPVLEMLGEVGGDYVAPDRHIFTNTFSGESALLGLPSESGSNEVIAIGDDAWFREFEQAKPTADERALEPWSERRIPDLIADGTATFSSLDLDVHGWVGVPEDGDIPPGALVGTELRNCVETIHYKLDKSVVTGLPFVVGLSDAEEFTYHMWVDSQTGVVVAFDVSVITSAQAFLGAPPPELGVSADTQLVMDVFFYITRINDPSIAVQAPAQ
jgi:hypothetical protein